MANLWPTTPGFMRIVSVFNLLPLLCACTCCVKVACHLLSTCYSIMTQLDTQFICVTVNERAGEWAVVNGTRLQKQWDIQAAEGHGRRHVPQLDCLSVCVVLCAHMTPGRSRRTHVSSTLKAHTCLIVAQGAHMFPCYQLPVRVWFLVHTPAFVFLVADMSLLSVVCLTNLCSGNAVESYVRSNLETHYALKMYRLSRCAEFRGEFPTGC